MCLIQQRTNNTSEKSDILRAKFPRDATSSMADYTCLQTKETTLFFYLKMNETT